MWAYSRCDGTYTVYYVPKPTYEVTESYSILIGLLYDYDTLQTTAMFHVTLRIVGRPLKTKFLFPNRIHFNFSLLHLVLAEDGGHAAKANDPLLPDLVTNRGHPISRNAWRRMNQTNNASPQDNLNGLSDLFAYTDKDEVPADARYCECWEELHRQFKQSFG